MITLTQLIVNLAIILLGQLLANKFCNPGDNIVRLQTESSDIPTTLLSYKNLLLGQLLGNQLEQKFN